MAGFEGTRVGPVVTAAREWSLGRFAPLYAAGIAAGIGIGLAITSSSAGGTDVERHEAGPQVWNEQIIDAAPVFASPPNEVIGQNPALSIDLPLEFVAVMGTWAPQNAPSAIPTAEPPALELVPASLAAPTLLARPAAVPQAVAPPQPIPAAEPAATSKPNFYVPQVSASAATAMELSLLSLINLERTKEGLTPYVLEAGLTKIARTRSQQLIDQNYFAHRDPYGYSMYVELLAHFGYTSYAWAGENLAMNNWPADASDDEAIRGLMNSPTHRANILAGDFSRIGVGEVTAADGRHFFTMIFLS